jgi:hypothetical protein
LADAPLSQSPFGQAITQVTLGAVRPYLIVGFEAGALLQIGPPRILTVAKTSPPDSSTHGILALGEVRALPACLTCLTYLDTTLLPERYWRTL